MSPLDGPGHAATSHLLGLTLAAAAVLVWSSPLIRIPTVAGDTAGAGVRTRGASRLILGGAVPVTVVSVLATYAVGTGGVLAALTSPRSGFAQLVAGCAIVGLLLRRRAAARRRAHGLAVAAGSACDLLVGELAAGSAPTQALRRIATTEPMLIPVAGTAVLGGDVPRALRRLAADSGISAWARVADAWEVSAREGASLTGVLAQVAAGERDAAVRRRLVQQELAEARATARMMTLLPWLLVAAGSMGGGGALQVLTNTWLGVTSAGIGCVFAVLGLVWLERIERTGTGS